MRPSLRFLNRPHSCSYCQAVNGVTFNELPKVRGRLLWVRCRCGRSHYACFECAARIGHVRTNGLRMIAECARGYYRKNKDRIAADRGAKGGL